MPSAVPSVGIGSSQSPGVLLMRRLARDAERLRDLRPRPAFGHSALDPRVLDPVGETPERADGGESFRGIIGQRPCGGRLLAGQDGAVRRALNAAASWISLRSGSSRAPAGARLARGSAI